MQILAKTSPYVRKETSTKRMMIDVLIALLPVVLFAIYRFKADAVFRILVSWIVMVGGEALFYFFTHRPDHTKEGILNRWKSRFKGYSVNNVTAPSVSAVIFALLLPSKIDYAVVIIGALFAILVAKMFFGGLGANIFNPAAMGRFFVLIALGSFFTASSYEGIISGATPLQVSGGALNGLAFYSLRDLFFGNIPGNMGEINALAILIGLAYLLIRRAADFRVVLSGLVTFTVLMVFAGLKLAPNHVLNFVLFHLLSGGLLFGLVFMATDPVTSPVTRPGRILYGFIIALVVVAFRLTNKVYPEGMVISILAANMLVPLIDLPKWATNRYKWQFITAMVIALAVASVIIYLAV